MGGALAAASVEFFLNTRVEQIGVSVDADIEPAGNAVFRPAYVFGDVVDKRHFDGADVQSAGFHALWGK